VDKIYFRPLEVDYLKGDSSKAYKKLKFQPKYNLDLLINEMIESDLSLAKKEFEIKSKNLG
jgi:GDPmannose 4,6-dehydratase